MIFDPTLLDLTTLFADPGMFTSRRAWRRAGFSVFDPAKETEIMVASHPSAIGYLFKKYTDDVKRKEQNRNYDARTEGAHKLARFVSARRLSRVVVPRKRLHELPRNIFGKEQHVLVVERLDLVGREASERRYRDIDEATLRELLVVLAAFPGLDSNSKNVQFTRAGAIAFVDLENWHRPDRKKVRLKSIGRYLSRERLQLAEGILRKLE